MLGGTLSTRTEIAGGSLPSDPVLISPRISRLYPSVPREHPRMSRFSSFSLTLSLPLSVAFLSQLLRETYFSLYNFTFRARCSSVSRVFREPGRKFPREEAQDYFSSAVPSAPSPLFCACSPLSAPRSETSASFPSASAKPSWSGVLHFLPASLINSRAHNYVCNLQMSVREMIGFHQFV